MAELTAADFGDLIAERIRAEHLSISTRWLERLKGMLSVEANDVFPTDQLLDHIPALIQELAGYVRAPEAEAVVANTAVITKAAELGELRHAQAASVHQLLAEYRLLGGILTSFVQQELTRLGVSPGAGEAIEVIRRLNEAIWLLMQTTVDTFIAGYLDHHHQPCRPARELQPDGEPRAAPAAGHADLRDAAAEGGTVARRRRRGRSTCSR